MEAEADEKRPYWPLLAMASADYVFGTPLRASVLVFGNTVLEITVRSGCYGNFPIHPEPALWDFCPRRTGFFVALLAYSVAMARKYRTACLYGKDLQQRLAQCVILVKGSSAQGERKEQINSSVVTVAADARAGSRRNFAQLQRNEDRRLPMRQSRVSSSSYRSPHRDASIRTHINLKNLNSASDEPRTLVFGVVPTSQVRPLFVVLAVPRGHGHLFSKLFSVRDRRSNIYLLSALNNNELNPYPSANIRPETSPGLEGLMKKGCTANLKSESVLRQAEYGRWYLPHFNLHGPDGIQPVTEFAFFSIEEPSSCSARTSACAKVKILPTPNGKTRP
ncbi:hypothetical protein C8F01DRAFT_1234012 [Mycena amicta]|nr:hypothetical protein C8F01DRAFT_1234012 [Mycena amicta]